MEAVTVTQWTGLACAAHCFSNPSSAYCRAQILLLHSLFCLSPVLGSFPDEQIDLQVWNSPYSSLWFFLMASYLLFSPGNSPTTQDKKKNKYTKIVMRRIRALTAFEEMDTPGWGTQFLMCGASLLQGCLCQETGEPHQCPCWWYRPTFTQNSLGPDLWRKTDNLPCPGSHRWGNGSALMF